MALTSKARLKANNIAIKLMPVIRIELSDLAATRRLGRLLAAQLKAGDVIALSGTLGAGKNFCQKQTCLFIYMQMKPQMSLMMLRD